MPDINPNLNISGGVKIELSGDFNAWTESISRAVGDLLLTYRMLIAGIGVTVIVLFLWCFFIRFCAGVLVWFSVLVIILAGVAVGVSVIKLSDAMLTGPTPDRADLVNKIGIAILIGTGIFTLMVISLHHRIQIAIEGKISI